LNRCPQRGRGGKIWTPLFSDYGGPQQFSKTKKSDLAQKSYGITFGTRLCVCTADVVQWWATSYSPCAMLAVQCCTQLQLMSSRSENNCTTMQLNCYTRRHVTRYCCTTCTGSSSRSRSSTHQGLQLPAVPALHDLIGGSACPAPSAHLYLHSVYANHHVNALKCYYINCNYHEGFWMLSAARVEFRMPHFSTSTRISTTQPLSTKAYKMQCL